MKCLRRTQICREKLLRPWMKKLAQIWSSFANSKNFMMKLKLFKMTWEKRWVHTHISPLPCGFTLFLHFQLSLVSTETPTKVQNTLREVDKLSKKLVTLEDQYSNLKIEARTHLITVDTFLSNFDSHLQEIERLELEFSYLKCVKTVEDLRYMILSYMLSGRTNIVTPLLGFSEKLQRSLQTNQDMEAVEFYNKLIQHNCILERSQCVNLKILMNDTIIFWFELLKEKLRKYSHLSFEIYRPSMFCFF